MKFQSALLSSASGSISGATFTSFRNVNVIRKKVGPREHISAFTQLRKQQQKLIAVQWKGLSEATRQQWQQLALQISKTNSFGQSYHQSGFNLYRERAFNAMLVGQTPLSTPVPNRELVTAVYGTNVNTLTSYNIRKTPGKNTFGNYVITYLARLGASYRDPRSLTYRLASVNVPLTASTLPIVTPYLATYGPFNGAKYKFVKLVWIDAVTFQRSLPQYIWAPPA